MAAMQPNQQIADALGAAVAHHRAGRLAEAEAIYRQVLQAQPDHAEAMHLLGVIALQCGNPQAGVELIERAIAAAPAMAGFYSNLGEGYRALGKLTEAERAYRKA